MSIEQDVIDIVVEQLGIDRKDVTADKSFVEDLNADSLDLTETMMMIEAKCNCDIPQQDAEKFKTVGDVIRYLEEKKKV